MGGAGDELAEKMLREMCDLLKEASSYMRGASLLGLGNRKKAREGYDRECQRCEKEIAKAESAESSAPAVSGDPIETARERGELVLWAADRETADSIPNQVKYLG